MIFRGIRKISTLFLMAGSVLAAISGITGCATPSRLNAPAKKAPDVDGFIKHWIILEPVSADGLTDSIVQAAVKRQYFPGQFTIIPKDGDKVMIEGRQFTWHAVTTEDYNVNLYYFAKAFNIISVTAI